MKTVSKNTILDYLKKIKEELHNKYGIKTLGLYGSYARDEANSKSDIDIFYERDSSFELESGLAFLSISEKLAKDLNVSKVDFVSLSFMNPVIKYYAKKDFIYVWFKELNIYFNHVGVYRKNLDLYFRI